MARKFKKKIASKPVKVEKKVLSIEIIGKEYFKKVTDFAKKTYVFAKNKLTNNE